MDRIHAPADALEPPALEFRAVRKSYRAGMKRKIAALRGVTLEVRPGEVFALLGRNGAGKTTLMKLALGLIRPNGGAGRVLGRPLGDVAARRAIGYQPEQPYLYPFLTVGETLRFFAELSGLAGASNREAVKRAAADCGLGEVLDSPVRRLSRGWLQRVVLAAALLPDPRLLLLDEPMSGLDPEARLAVKRLIARLREEGRTVVFSTHILPDAEALADRVALLRAGELAACGSLEDLLGEPDGFLIGVGGRVPAALAGPAERVGEEGREWRLAGEQACVLQSLLARWIAAGVEIRSVAPVRDGLESFVARALGQGAGGPHTRADREEGCEARRIAS